MSTYETRSSKKHGRGEEARPFYADMEEDSEMDSADGDFETVLEEQANDLGIHKKGVVTGKESSNKATGKKSSKQPPRKRRAKNPPASVVLDVDAIGLVMDFVGHQELLTLASSSKTLRDKLTMSMVVKSAFASGTGQASSTICSVKIALTGRGIHVPSPFRLLQLVNGKRCEECNEKCASRVVQRNISRFGFYCCNACRDGRLKTHEVAFEGIVPGSRFQAALSDSRLSVQHDMHHSRRVASASNEGLSVLVSFYQKICSDGEVVGPSVTPEQINAIQVQADEYPEKAMNEIIDEVLEFDPASTDSYKEFMAAYAIGLKLWIEVDETRQEQRKQASMKAARKRLANLDSVLDKLKNMLNLTIKDFALNYAGDENFVVTFSCPLVQEVLTNFGFVRAPTKVGNEVLEQVASTLNEKFEQLQELDLFSANFLPLNRRFYRQLKPLFQERFTDLASAAPKLNSHVFSLIDNGDLVGAMMALASFPFNSADFGCKLLDGLTTRSVRDDRVDMDALTGAHWLVCFRNPKNRNARAAFKEAWSCFSPTISMVNAFLHWVKAKKERTAGGRKDHIAALYRPACLRLICDGQFDKAYLELGSPVPLRATSTAAYWMVGGLAERYGLV